jgi:hypothetical protein
MIVFAVSAVTAAAVELAPSKAEAADVVAA